MQAVIRLIGLTDHEEKVFSEFIGPMFVEQAFDWCRRERFVTKDEHLSIWRREGKKNKPLRVRLSCEKTLPPVEIIEARIIRLNSNNVTVRLEANVQNTKQPRPGPPFTVECSRIIPDMDMIHAMRESRPLGKND